MQSTATYLDLLRQFKTEHGKEYGIVRIGIFGSVARNEHTKKSDIDIFYEGSSMGLKSLVQLPMELEKLFGVSVDVVRKHANMRLSFLRRIEKEVIYV